MQIFIPTKTNCIYCLLPCVEVFCLWQGGTRLRFLSGFFRFCGVAAFVLLLNAVSALRGEALGDDKEVPNEAFTAHSERIRLFAGFLHGRLVSVFRKLRLLFKTQRPHTRNGCHDSTSPGGTRSRGKRTTTRADFHG